MTQIAKRWAEILAAKNEEICQLKVKCAQIEKDHADRQYEAVLDSTTRELQSQELYKLRWRTMGIESVVKRLEEDIVKEREATAAALREVEEMKQQIIATRAMWRERAESAEEQLKKLTGK